MLVTCCGVKSFSAFSPETVEEETSVETTELFA